MALAIFWVLLLLIAAIEEKGFVREKERREKILQRLKEQEKSLRLLHLSVRKEIADLEARQEALARPALTLEKKIQHYISQVLYSAAMTLFKLWG